MPFHGATLPAGAGRGQDRWSAVDGAAVVLDGASSFTPDTADASEYVDLLLHELSTRVTSTEDLRRALVEAIHATSQQLCVRAGEGPSSTVLLAREHAARLEILALGDSTAIVKTNDGVLHRICDNRLSHTATEIRRQYRERLESGSGYDEAHRALLGELQRQERRLRNTTGGYWIAEADPAASYEAVQRTFDLDDVAWCVLATDGAQRVVDHLGLSWEDIAAMSAPELLALLRRLHNWEQFEDPTAKFLPRAKRHDDKVLVAWSPVR